MYDNSTVMLQHMVRSAILVIPWFWQWRWDKRRSQVEFSSPGYCKDYGVQLGLILSHCFDKFELGDF